MNIGIVGAGGEIGVGLTKFLKSNSSYKIIPITRSKSGQKENCQRICDLRNPHQILRALEGIEVVINLSGRTTGIEYEDFYIDNYICSINLYKGCLKAGVKRIIHVSSILALLHPETAYGQTKALTDKFLLSQPPTDLSLIILRPSWVVTSSPKSIIHQFIKFIRLSPVLLVPNTGQVQPLFEGVFYKFVRQCIEKTIKKYDHKIIYCVGFEKFKLNEFLKLLSEVIDKKRLIFEFPFSILINLAKIGAALFPKLSIDFEKLQIQKSDRIHSEICPELEIFQKPAKEEMQQIVASIRSNSRKPY